MGRGNRIIQTEKGLIEAGRPLVERGREGGTKGATMIKLNLWFFLVVFMAMDVVAIGCFILGQGIGKARLIEQIMTHLRRKPPYLQEHVKEFEEVIVDLAEGGIA